jgi:alpha-ketoglutaric semialdehyde dehydrogenase
MPNLTGRSLIGAEAAEALGPAFHAVNPATGMQLKSPFYSATVDDIDRAANLAADASDELARFSGHDRAILLRRIAENLLAEGTEIVERVNLESGLPVPRLQSELKRTTSQLNLFADLLDEGSWVNARIDDADRERKPVPRPDIRSMLRPLGPVAVFGASNFPLAFSVAGGDTASALAAGNPVVVKAHPAHPGTSELVGKLIQKAVKDSSFPGGIFSMLFDAGTEVGIALVQHPAIKAVAFTGSAVAGQTLMRLAARRPEPIPCYAEMGSTNPLFILSEAIRERGAQIAQALQASFTLGSGQFCTKPGIVFIPASHSAEFERTLKESMGTVENFLMLTRRIAENYEQAIEQRLARSQAELVAGNSGAGNQTCVVSKAAVFRVTLEDFLRRPELGEEVFGPTTLLVYYGKETDLLSAAQQLRGHLTATIHGTDEDLGRAKDLIRVLETKVGRIIFNGFPTGVEVSHAMVHGGPFPATSDGRSTSVGTQAILRFVRPVCFQDFPDAALPPELKNDNPLGLMRLVNGTFTRG